MKRIISIVTFVKFTLITLSAQTGTISGKVTDAKTGEELVGATVMIDGTTTGTVTNFMGEYTLTNIAPGSYSFKCQFISYEPQVKEKIIITSNETTTVNFALSTAEMNLKEVQIVAKANRESENMLLMERKKSLLMKETIGAQELSRKGAGDAEDAVTKVSGVTKQEGVRNVFVRGLGDRFNSTTLNGFPIPSEDPEYKNISLDFFASDIIKAIDVNKVFNGGMTGDVGGAEININSKELIGDSDLNLDVSASANSDTYNKDFLVPDGISDFGFAQNTKSPSSGDTYAFKNSLDPSMQDFQLGKGIGISGGKRFELGSNSNPLTFYIIGNYSNNYNFTDGVTRQTTTDGTIYRDQNTKKYEKESLHFATANLNYSFRTYSLTYNSLAIHTTNGVLRDDFGMHGNPFNNNADNNYSGLIRRQQTNDNTLFVNQLLAKKDFNARLSVNVGVSYNITDGKEPDRRVNYLTYYNESGQNTLEPLLGSGYQHRYFGELKEKDLNALAKVSYKLSNSKDNLSSLEFGYRGRFLTDDYHASAWDNNRRGTLPLLDRDNFSLDEIFNQEQFAEGYFINDNYKVMMYTVDKNIHSAYTEFNYQLTSSLIMNLGLKADNVNIALVYDLNLNDTDPPKSNSIDEFYFLPSLNLKYNLNSRNALRLGASRTYTLPQSKEISPMLYEGPQWSSQGNPGLVPSVNYNLDLKWDFYLTPEELISVTAFGKLIQKPISRVEFASANGWLSYANIADEAKIAGLEIEIKKTIFSSSSTEGTNTKNKLSSGINFSYIQTGVKLNSKSGNLPLDFTNKESELEGASPILTNADLTYQYKKNDFELTTSGVINYFSDRIYSIGVGGEYGYEDVVENGLATLDFISSFKLKKHWGIKLKAKNLLDPEFKLTRKPSGTDKKPIILSSYRKGLGFSIGLSYQL